jgi:hypothetical protein
MNYVALPLQPTSTSQHTRGENDPPLLLEQVRPDDQVGDANPVLNCDEARLSCRVGTIWRCVWAFG